LRRTNPACHVSRKNCKWFQKPCTADSLAHQQQDCSQMGRCVETDFRKNLKSRFGVSKRPRRATRKCLL
jgi:hypothetical protein